MSEQINMFEMLEQSAMELRSASRLCCPDVFIAHPGEPFRVETLNWYMDYDWHMAVHECNGVIYEREREFYRHWLAGTLDKWYKAHPVVYCNTHKGIQWMDNNPYHHQISTCPYCGANLDNGEGDIVLRRRKSLSIICVYELGWPDRKPTQPYLIEYMRTRNILPTEQFQVMDYIIWITGKHSEFKRSNGYFDGAVVLPEYKKAFTEWLEREP